MQALLAFCSFYGILLVSSPSSDYLPVQATQTPAQPLGCASTLVARAAQEGWLNPTLCEPGEYLAGIASLPLGAGVVPVRFVENSFGVEGLLEGIAAEVSSGTSLENYIVLGKGFSPEHVGSVRASVQRAGRRVHVGTRDDYEKWLSVRLGQVGRLGPESPMRHLLERFLQYSGRPLPTIKYPWDVYYKKKNKIAKSFHLGALGSQAIWTLFAHLMGAESIENVESNTVYQPYGIDFFFKCAIGGRFGRRVSADIKTEKKKPRGFPTRNLALELYSNLEARIIGWLLNPDTAMEILISLNWYTGDGWVVSFPELLSWYLAEGVNSLHKTTGTAPGQSYHSEIALLPVSTLFEKLKGSAFHFNLRDWIGKAYLEEKDIEFETFMYQSVMPPQFSSYTLKPQI